MLSAHSAREEQEEEKTLQGTFFFLSVDFKNCVFPQKEGGGEIRQGKIFLFWQEGEIMQGKLLSFFLKKSCFHKN